MIQDKITFLHISQNNEIFFVTDKGYIYRSNESSRIQNLLFQRFYDYDNEEYGPVVKILKGTSFFAALTKNYKLFTTFSESGHHLKTFREISKFKNLRIFDVGVGDKHILVVGIPRSIKNFDKNRFFNRTAAINTPDLNANLIGKIENDNEEIIDNFKNNENDIKMELNKTDIKEEIKKDDNENNEESSSQIVEPLNHNVNTNDHNVNTNDINKTKFDEASKNTDEKNEENQKEQEILSQTNGEQKSLEFDEKIQNDDEKNSPARKEQQSQDENLETLQMENQKNELHNNIESTVSIKFSLNHIKINLYACRYFKMEMLHQ